MNIVISWGRTPQEQLFEGDPKNEFLKISRGRECTTCQNKSEKVSQSDKRKRTRYPWVQGLDSTNTETWLEKMLRAQRSEGDRRKDHQKKNQVQECTNFLRRS